MARSVTGAHLHETVWEVPTQKSIARKSQNKGNHKVVLISRMLVE